MCVMKLNKYFMMGAMGLSLVACSDNLDENGQGANGTNPNEGTTYVAINLDFENASNSRVGEQPIPGGNDPTATTGESTINTVRIIIIDAYNNVEINELFPNSTTTQVKAEGEEYYFEITPGMKYFYAFVNEGSSNGDLTSFSGNAVVNGGASAFYTPASGENLATNFAMSSTEAVSQEIIDGISEEALATSDDNHVSITVERVLAKVTVDMAQNFTTEGQDNFELKNLSCQIGNADNLEYNGTDYTASGTYRMANNTGANGARITPYYPYPSWGENTPTGWSSAELLPEGDYSPVYNGTTSTQAVFYCLENTHEEGEYTISNTTFLRIEATTIPKNVITFSVASSEGAVTITPNGPTAVSGVDEAKTFYRITKTPAGQEDYYNTYIFEDELEKYTAAGETLAAIITTFKNAGYDFDEYTDGAGKYNLWVNDYIYNETSAQQSTNMAPVFRNDWYLYTINSIVLPGSPTGDGDGDEETDPDPEPEDPDQPIHPDTNIGVKLSIEPWNVVKHYVDL